MESYIDFIEKNHIRPIKLDIGEKQEYYFALENISNSWTGRIDALFANTFIQESVYLLTNAIFLFENGYFDCAYYSLRQSLEVSTTINYLLELNPETRKEKLFNWKTQKKFPMIGKMLDFLKANEDVYFDMFNNMKDYFIKLDDTKRKLNKFVHKQGDEYFYITRNHPLNSNYNANNYLKEFTEYLKVCIGAVAVFRLGIDPMPILLMDEEIYYRTEDVLTSAFGNNFVEEYIGLNHIKNFMKTQVYSDHYNYLIKKEKQIEYVKDVIKHNYIDKNMTKDILKQKHLLSKNEYLIVSLCDLIEKITKVYVTGGMHMYHTNLKTTRTKSSFGGKFFCDLAQQENSINCVFDEAYISYFKFEDNLDAYLEHNEILTKDEIEIIKAIKVNN
ncbi:MAG: hypothetical protein ACRDDH_14445 [Cetobacterium sp.]|uniref:hypothetical protein n=1 Tax=Cetobacterium sp. TaxID=2071632 RepID=UPI003EE73C0D